MFGHEYGKIKWVTGWLWSYLPVYLTGKDVQKLFGLSWKTSALFLWEDKGGGVVFFDFAYGVLLPPHLFLFATVDLDVKMPFK